MEFNTVFEAWLTANKIAPQVREIFNIFFTDKIVFPVYDIDGNFLFNKYRRNPLTEEGPKYTYDFGGKVTLYGYHLAKEHDTILITEGEKDCLVSWSHNIPAITSTGGALSFQENWIDLLKDKNIIIGLDNDKAGYDGLVKILDMLPNARILLLPDIPNVKDISDYVNMGGNLTELINTARHFKDISEVKEDRIKRIAYFQSVGFHDAYIKKHTKVNNYTGERKTFSSDKVMNAKGYPVSQLLSFDKKGKTKCPFHNEKTESFQYYKATNSCYCFGCGKYADAIDIYKQIHSCTFTEAVKFLNQ